MAKRIIRLEQDIDSLESDQSTKQQPTKKRKSRLKLFIGLLLIAVGFGLFLPQIASHTALGDWAIRQFLPEDFGHLTVARRNLSWWSPVEVGDVRLLDPSGELLAEVGELKTKETLWQIVSTGQVTRIDIDQAAGRLVWRADGSNWEDYVYSILDTMSSDSSSTMADMEIHVTNSQAILESQTDDQRWSAMDVQSVVLVKDNANDIQIQSSCSLLDAKSNISAGNCETFLAIGNQAALQRAVEQLQIQCGDSADFKTSTVDGGVAFTAKVEDTAASLARGIVRRYLPTLQLNGLATGKAAGVSNYMGDYVFVQTPKVIIQRLGVGDQQYLAGDFVQQNRVDVVGAFEMNPRGFKFYGTKANGDFGNADIDGTLDFQQLADIWQTRRLPVEGLSSSGKVDLALVASQLPNSLRLREGLQIQQGDLVWQVFNRRENDGSMRLFANTVLSNLKGQIDREQISWNTPVKLAASLRDYDQPIYVENLKVESNFVTASVIPKADGGGKVDFACDFDRMKAALDQFFQLPPMTMKGKGNGWAQWTLKSTGATVPDVDAQLVLNLQNANLILPGVFELRDPNIALTTETSVQLNPQATAADWFNSLMQSPELVVRSGKIDLKTGEAAIAAMNNPGVPFNPAVANGEVPLGFTAKIDKPVQVSRLLAALNRISGYGAGAAATSQPVLEADIQIDGPLENWVEMVRPLLAGADIAITGISQSKAKLILMDSYATLGALNIKGQQFGFRGYNTIIQEPIVQITGGLSYHYDNGLLHLGDLTVASATAVVQATQTKIRMHNGSPVLNGELAFRANVARLYQTISLLQVASTDIDTRLGTAQPLIDQQQQLIRQLAGRPAAPEYDAIQLVSFTEPAAAPVESSSNDLQLGGELVGTAQFTQNELAETVIKLNSNLNQAWVGGIQPNGQLAAYIKEPVIEIKGDGKLSADANRLDFANLTVRSQRMAAGIAGRIDQMLVNPTVQINAGANADLIQWLQPIAGDSLGDLNIDGLREHQIQLNGPIDINQMSGSWTTNWKSIGWMGLEGGAANIALNLNKGILKMQPLQFMAGGGRVNLAPEVDLRGETIWVRLPQGFVFDQVKLTPQLCRNWLKYAAPLLAEITSVEGTFSLDSDGIEVPISNWQSMVAKARVTINGARVGPGPLGTQIGQVISAVKTVSDGGSLDAAALGNIGLGGLSGLAASGNGQRTAALEELASGVLGNLGNGQKPNLGQLVAGNSQGGTSLVESTKTWMDIPKQTIGLNFKDGGVVHDQLKMNIKGFELVSNGRVGLDQSLDVQTQLNIPQEVLAKNEDIANAFGPSVNLPIKGTLMKPSLQSGQLRTALNTAVNRSVQKAVGDQLEKKLGVPGLGELGLGQPGQGLGGGSANPLNGLMQQGQQQLQQQQQKLGDKLNEKLGLPSGSNPLQGILPGTNSPPANNGNGTSNNNSPSPANSINNLFNQQLDRGLNKLFKNDPK